LKNDQSEQHQQKQLNNKNNSS